MRKCAVFGVALLALLSLTFPNQASAQSVWVGGGATLPVSDYGGYASTGWMGVGGVSFPIGQEKLSLFGEGFYGQNSHEIDGDKTNLYGAHGGVMIDLAPEGGAGIYLFGQVGFMVHKYTSDDFPEFDESDTGLAFGGGGGYSFPVGSFTGWVEGRYLQGQFDGEDGNTAFAGVMAGVSFPLGGNGG